MSQNLADQQMNLNNQYNDDTIDDIPEYSLNATNEEHLKLLGEGNIECKYNLDDIGR